MSLPPDVAPSTVTVVNEFPEDLYDAMRTFVRNHPNWDQYRLMQVALAGFLFQQGSRERAVSRHYLDGLFDRAAGPQEATAGRSPAARSTPVPQAPLPAPEPPPSARVESGGRQVSGGHAGHPQAPARPLPVPPPLTHRQGVSLPPHRLRSGGG